MVRKVQDDGAASLYCHLYYWCSILPPLLLVSSTGTSTTGAFYCHLYYYWCPLLPSLGPAASTLLGNHSQNTFAHCLYLVFCLSVECMYFSILCFQFFSVLYFVLYHCSLLSPHAENPLAQWNHRLLPPSPPHLH